MPIRQSLYVRDDCTVNNCYKKTVPNCIYCIEHFINRPEKKLKTRLTKEEKYKLKTK